MCSSAPAAERSGISDAVDLASGRLGLAGFGALTGALLAIGSLSLAVNAVMPQPSIILIFVVSGAMSAANGFHRPALDALTPRLVERDDLRAVSALNSLRYSLSAIAGPALPP